MENKCLPPHNFEKLVMDKINNAEIEKCLSVRGKIFIFVSCALCFLMAMATEQEYFENVLRETGLYIIFGRCYNIVLNLEEMVIEFDGVYLIASMLFIIMGLGIVVYSIMFGVKNNG